MSRQNTGVVNREELKGFADTLFHYLYSNFDLVLDPDTNCEHFRSSMVTAILCVEQVTSEFNQRIINDFMLDGYPLEICEAVSDSYPSTDYFKKFFYVSAFILDFVYWHSKLFERNELSVGPLLWLVMFRRDFLPEFDLNGGWQGFADAGVATAEFYNTYRNEPDFSDRFLPASYIQEISSRIASMDQDRSFTEEMRSIFQGMSIHDPLAVGQPGGKPEEDQPGKVEQESQPPPVAPETTSSEGTSKEMGFDSPPDVEITQQSPVKKSHRKRRHESGDTQLDAEHLDQELSPVSVQPEKKKAQTVTPPKGTSEKSGESSKKTPRKRKHDSPTKDSDEELDLPSSFKAKVEKK